MHSLQTIAETCARWTPVEDELRAMLGGVSSADLTRRHTLGQAALLTYAVSKRLVKLPEHADLLPHLAQMRSEPLRPPPVRGTASGASTDAGTGAFTGR